MKPCLMTVLVFAIACLVLSSCHRTPPRPAEPSEQEEKIAPQELKPVTPGLAEALDKMGLENAPTLGSVSRRLWEAFVEGEYETIYDNMSKSFQDIVARGMDIEILDCQNTLQGYRDKLKVADNETDKTALADSISKEEEKLAELQALDKDARKYYAWGMRHKSSVAEDRRDILEGKVLVLGETIEGDKGTVLMKFPHGKTLDVFVKENGEWKWDGVARPEPEPAPDKANEEAVSPELQKALDKMGLENAPTLGPAYRKLLECAAAKRFDLVYDSAPTSAKEKAASDLAMDIDIYQTQIKEAESKLSGPGMTDKEKAKFAAELEYRRGVLAHLLSFNGDAKQYFVYRLQKQPDMRDFAAVIIKGGVAVTGEQIDGGKGQLFLEHANDGVTSVNFIKEDGVWRFADPLYDPSPAIPQPPAPPNP